MNRDVRRIGWRMGRALYMRARGDVPNHPQANGEYALVDRVLRAFRQQQGDPKLVMFDIGANVGDWAKNTLELARSLRLSQMELHAFEPAPDTAAALASNLRTYSNNTTVHVRPIALSSRTGEGFIYVAGELAGTNSVHAAPEHQEATKFAIHLSTLDDYCAAHGVDHIVFAKCDAEGHDMEVLLGARNSLARGAIGLFQFEYNHRWIYGRHFLKDVFDFVQGMHYTVGRIMPDRVELIDAWHPELERFFEANYLLVHDSMRPLLSARRGTFDAYNTFVLTS